MLAELLWAHTPNYPDEPPLVKARRCTTLLQDVLHDILVPFLVAPRIVRGQCQEATVTVACVLALPRLEPCRKVPDSPGLAALCSEKGLSDSDVAQLQGAVDAAVQENLGMAMVYGLVTAAQEWLTDKARRQARVPLTASSCMSARLVASCCVLMTICRHALGSY